MQDRREDTIHYQRSRFSSWLPVDRLYTPSHFWLIESEPGLWRVGFTGFATRLLGELVEHEFEARPGEAVEVGQTIGWVEGFKALTDLNCVANGEFVGGNPVLTGDVALACRNPYGLGWLYSVLGTPGPSLDLHAYMRLLDLAIDEMREKCRE